MINGKRKLKEELFKDKHFNNATLYIFKNGNWSIAKKLRESLFKDQILFQERVYKLRSTCRDEFNKILSHITKKIGGNNGLC
jgi:arsenate reductase-like glutaredoxin family protein